MDSSPPGSSVDGDSPGKNTGVGCHAFLQIFLTQGSTQESPAWAGGFFTASATWEAHGISGVYMSIPNSQIIPPHPTFPPWYPHVCLYIRVSISALQTGSKEPSFQIPHIRAHIRYSYVSDSLHSVQHPHLYKVIAFCSFLRL